MGQCHQPASPNGTHSPQRAPSDNLANSGSNEDSCSRLLGRSVRDRTPRHAGRRGSANSMSTGPRPKTATTTGSFMPGGRPLLGANLMSLCRGTKVSFGSTGEVSAAPAASAVRMEESRNVRRFMILSIEARRSFANARFRRGRGFVSRWRRGPRRGGQRRSFTRPRSKERRRTSHSTSNGAPNSG